MGSNFNFCYEVILKLNRCICIRSFTVKIFYRKLNTAIIFAQIWNQFCLTVLLSSVLDILYPYFLKTYVSFHLLKASFQSVNINLKTNCTFNLRNKNTSKPAGLTKNYLNDKFSPVIGRSALFRHRPIKSLCSSVHPSVCPSIRH